MKTPKVVQQKDKFTSNKLAPLASRNAKEPSASRGSISKKVVGTTRSVSFLQQAKTGKLSKDELFSQGKYLKKTDSDNPQRFLPDHHSKMHITPSKKIKLNVIEENENVKDNFECEMKENLKKPTPSPSEKSGNSTGKGEGVLKSRKNPSMKFSDSQMKLQSKKKTDVTEDANGAKPYQQMVKKFFTQTKSDVMEKESLQQDLDKEIEQYTVDEIHAKMHVTESKKNKVDPNEENKNVRDPPKIVTKKDNKQYTSGPLKKFAAAATKQKKLNRLSLNITKPNKTNLSCPKVYLKQMVSGSKPNWQEIKRLSTELKAKRKKRKMTYYEKILEAKKLWEEARKEDCSNDRRQELVVSMYKLLSENLEKSVFIHDTSRMIQWIIKHSTPTTQSSIYDSLKPVMLDMIQNKFSSHIVKKLLICSDKYCVPRILQVLRGNIVKLMCNSVASPLIEFIYSSFATSEQKRLMEREFFGQTVAILTGEETTDLKSILARTTERNMVLEQIKETIIKIIEREHFASSLLHAVSIEYLDFASPKQKEEVLTAFHPHVLSLIKTKAGARISMQCCWYLPKKAKKTILKKLKGKVVDVCMSEEGYWLLLALLDSVDDTVLLKKIIISEVMENILNIVKHEKGRKVLLYLVCYRDTAYFHPKDIEVLSTADTCGSMLKPLSARRSEIANPVMDTLLQFVSSDVRPWFEDPSVAMVLLAILKVGEGAAFRSALKATAEFVSSDIQVMEKEKEKEMPLIEHTGFSLVLKKLVKLDEAKKHKKDMFSFHLASAVSPATIRKWIGCNRGCFLLASVLEVRKTRIIKILKEKINDDMLNEIRLLHTAGAKLLRLLLLSTGSVEDS